MCPEPSTVFAPHRCSFSDTSFCKVMFKGVEYFMHFYLLVWYHTTPAKTIPYKPAMLTFKLTELGSMRVAFVVLGVDALSLCRLFPESGEGRAVEENKGFSLTHKYI